MLAGGLVGRRLEDQRVLHGGIHGGILARHGDDEDACRLHSTLLHAQRGHHELAEHAELPATAQHVRHGEEALLIEDEQLPTQAAQRADLLHLLAVAQRRVEAPVEAVVVVPEHRQRQAQNQRRVQRRRDGELVQCAASLRGKEPSSAYAVVQRKKRLRQGVRQRGGGRRARQARRGVAQQRLVEEEVLWVRASSEVTSTGSSRQLSSDCPCSATIASASYA